MVHWQGTTSVRGTVDGGGTLLLRAIVVMIPLLLVIAGDVERNPGPEGKFGVWGDDISYGEGCLSPFIHSIRSEGLV